MSHRGRVRLLSLLQSCARSAQEPQQLFRPADVAVVVATPTQMRHSHHARFIIFDVLHDIFQELRAVLAADIVNALRPSLELASNRVADRPSAKTINQLHRPSRLARADAERRERRRLKHREVRVHRRRERRGPSPRS